MASAFYPDINSELKNICGIDLSDYFIDKGSYNPIVYIHKKYLSKDKNNGINVEEQCTDQNKHDKSQQFDYDKTHCETCKTNIINNEYYDPVVDETIRFAKSLIPLTMPPNTNLNNPVYYTIKPSKKIKRKHEICAEDGNKNKTVEKENVAHTREAVKSGKCKRTKENLSARSISHISPNNTIDDINENQSLSYSLSETSERKHSKRDEFAPRNKKHESQKIVASESFEAIAAEHMNTSSDSKIKIHLMNEADKHLLYEGIRSPLVKAIKECFVEFNHKNEVNTEIQNIHKTIQSQTSKLDRIFERLTCIENKLNILDKTASINKFKSSKLEELGRDIIDVKEDLSSEEELACVNLAAKSRGRNTPVTPVHNEKDTERKVEIWDKMARGESIPETFMASTSQLGMKPERPIRIPTRFCWTEAARIN